ncbi:MAG: hypothetical protein MZU97_26460 [Bacillus subtilis]|nr:hypothetical protein [Bacillus subtilis]
MITTPLVSQNLEAAYLQLNPIIPANALCDQLSPRIRILSLRRRIPAFTTLLYAQAALMTVFLVVRFVHRLIAAKAKQHYLAENPSCKSQCVKIEKMKYQTN